MDVLRLTLRQLQIFVAVARHGSTLAAGDDIALSQSATSAAVNELERTLGLRLFDRVGRRLLLNESGRQLLPRAMALIDGAMQFEHAARDGGGALQSLRIGASTTVGNYVLPGVLAGLARTQPNAADSAWRSRVVIGNTAVICDAVAAFELDVGLIEGACHQPALTVTPWLLDELVVVAASGSAVAQGDGRVTLRALRDAVWLLREPGSGTREATDQGLLPHLRSYRRSIELGSSEAIKHAVEAGLGVACLSHWVVDDAVASGRLVRLATTLPRLRRQFYMVWHRDKQLTPALQALVQQALQWPKLAGR